jgi:tRNA threonylcarbamoyladenosine biosynthesis protein TsaB
MHVLALDTTTRDGSVALVDQQGIVEECHGDAARSHAERLPGELIRLAGAHGLSLGEIDLFAVAAGPGSFTGLRIGIATIQGLALTTGRRIVAVSALEALAQGGGAAPGTFVAAWMDARRQDVFTALYEITDAAECSRERLVEVEEPSVGKPAATLSRWSSRIREASVLFVGDGAMLYADSIETFSKSGVASWKLLPETPLLAGAIGRMALSRAERGETIDPAAVHPLYVRRPDAEVERERKAVQHSGHKGQ